MILRVVEFPADNSLTFARLVSGREAQPMVPENGKIEIAYERAIRWIGKDVIHAAR